MSSADKKKRLQDKLNDIRQYAYASKIQSLWRGKLIRAIYNNNNKVKPMSSITLTPIADEIQSEIKTPIRLSEDDERYAPSKFDIPIELHNNSSETIWADQLCRQIRYSISFGVNFPLCCTCTRLLIRVVDDEYHDIISPLHSFAAADSDAMHPLFNFTFLLPSLQKPMFVVIRIDTLERPSLQYKCVSYALSKVYIDLSTREKVMDNSLGFQNIHRQVRTGVFLLRLFYGDLPRPQPSIRGISNMPTIEGSFLCITMAFSDQKHVFRNIVPNEIARLLHTIHPEVFFPDTDSAGTIAYLLVQALRAHPHGSLPKLKLDRSILESFLDKDASATSPHYATTSTHVLEVVTDWIMKAMPPSSEYPSMKINVGMISHYHREKGLLIGVDELHNMPRRPPAPPRSHVIVAHTLNLFKVYMELVNGSPSNIAPHHIVDVSTQIDPHSCEICPRFLDDLTNIHGSGVIRSRAACIVIRVVAIDICLEDRPSSSRGGRAKRRFRRRMTKEGSMSTIVGRVKRKTSIYRNDQLSWWGMIPLTRSCPFNAIPTHKGSASIRSPRTDIFSIPSRCEKNGLFTNLGTHLVPLFEGSPPAHLLVCPDPYSQLLQETRDSYGRLYESDSYEGSSAVQMWHSLMSCGYKGHTARDRIPPDNFHLSHGASAIIRIADGRLHELRNAHFGDNLEVELSMDVAKTLFAATVDEKRCSKEMDFSAVEVSRVETLTRQFAYHQSLGDKEKSMDELIAGQYDFDKLLTKVNKITAESNRAHDA